VAVCQFAEISLAYNDYPAFRHADGVIIWEDFFSSLQSFSAKICKIKVKAKIMSK